MVNTCQLNMEQQKMIKKWWMYGNIWMVYKRGDALMKNERLTSHPAWQRPGATKWDRRSRTVWDLPLYGSAPRSSCTFVRPFDWNQSRERNSSSRCWWRRWWWPPRAARASFPRPWWAVGCTCWSALPCPTRPDATSPPPEREYSRRRRAARSGWLAGPRRCQRTTTRPAVTAFRKVPSW